jgi:hypothetical protein
MALTITITLDDGGTPDPRLVPLDLPPLFAVIEAYGQTPPPAGTPTASPSDPTSQAPAARPIIDPVSPRRCRAPGPPPGPAAGGDTSRGMRMAFVCVTGGGAKTYFNTSDVVKVLVPIDIPAGRKPCGWPDYCAATLTLGRRGEPVELAIGHDEWPAVKAALGLDNAVVGAAGGS